MARPHILEQFDNPELINGYRSLIEDTPLYLAMSREMAASEAFSYRGFKVGNLGVGIRPGIYDDNTGELKLFTFDTANFKGDHLPEKDEHLIEENPDPEDPDSHELKSLHRAHALDLVPRKTPKVCAEMATILEAEEQSEILGPLYLLANFITATGNKAKIKDVTERHTETLTPCDQCVAALDATPMTSRATLYISATRDLMSQDMRFQVRNMTMLKDLYSSGREDVPVIRVGQFSVEKALEYYDRRIAAHHFSGKLGSRVISGFAKAALNESYVG